MATLTTVRLNKGDSPNWGFRLQGGKDFGTPLIIQKVIVGSPAERAGLIAGDSVIKVNNTDVFNLRHKDAQDVLLRAGNNFDMTIQRGGSTWKPSVIPTGNMGVHSPSISSVSPVTKTSLAARPSENIGAIGTGHNVAAKPFPHVNGAVNGGPKLVNSQYNTPIKLYSEESIAETLSAQTEVLSTGALGVNFKKNERNYDASNSEVLRLLKEEENSPKSPVSSDYQPHSPAVASGVDTSPLGVVGLRHVSAPEQKPAPPSPQLPPGQNVCADCERLIVGVFVRIKDKNLHVECFKCSTCGTSLKNVGYYNINNKLYCDIHAKLAARNNPPAPNLVPVTIPPGGKIPANAISAALATHSYPTSAPLSPQINSHQSGPKPFASTSPLSPTSYSTLPRAVAPLSPIVQNSAPSYSPVSSTGQSVHNIVWPPAPEGPDIPTASPLYFPPPSHVKVKPREISESSDFSDDRARYQSESTEYSDLDMMEQSHHHQKMSICSEEVSSYTSGRRSVSECAETIAETLSRQKLIEDIVKSRPQSPPPSFEPLVQTIMDEPEIQQSCCLKKQDNSCCLKKPEIQNSCCLKKQENEEVALEQKIENPVPKGWESQMVQALTTACEDTISLDSFSSIPSKKTTTALGSALAVAPSEPFNTNKTSILDPVPLPEETVPYFPPEDLFTIALSEIEPPRGKKKADPTEKYFEDLPKPQEKLSMRSALTIAPERPYTPIVQIIEENKTESKENVSKTKTKTQKTKVIEKEESPVQIMPIFQGFSCSFQNKTDHSSFQVQISTTPPVPIKQEDHKKEEVIEEESIEKETIKRDQVKIAKQSEDVVYKKPLKLSETLHKPDYLPQYQVSISESAEADIALMERMEKAQARMIQQKENVTECKITKPVITVEPGDIQSHKNSFKPVVEDKPPSSTFSPRPRSVTPSIINKPPPVIPYYQANLVAQKHDAPTVKLLDPKSPMISRTPSPGPGVHSRPSSVRPKSPAPGPPPNVLQPGAHVPTKHDFKVEEAKENVSHYIPVHMEKMEDTMYTSECRMVTIPNTEYLEENRDGSSFKQQEHSLKQNIQSQGKQSHVNNGQITNISEKSNIDKEEQYRLSESKNVETSKDGTVIQRQKKVTEEFEHFHKEQEIVIEKNVSKCSFRNVNNPEIEFPAIMGLHVTNPNPISSPFLSGRGPEIVKPPETVPSKPAEKVAPPKPAEPISAPSKPHFDAKKLPPPSPPPKAKSDDCRPPAKPIKHINAPGVSRTTQNFKSDVPPPDTGAGGGRQSGAVGVAPKRGRGVLNAAQLGGRIPLCAQCHGQIRGPFITALGKIWCPDHFVCATPSCRRPLQDLGFVEEQGKLYCEYCFEQYLAPPCAKCGGKVKGDCLKAIGKTFHPECFCCVHCGKLFANNPFFLEDGNPYCEADWNEFFTTKCFACGFPVEAGDRWVEALNNNYHSQCFNCTMCKKNLEGQSFFAKGGRPYCKNHAR